MTREVHDIPPAPRRVRWRAVLWRWWPVAFAGFLLAVYGGLITLMLFLAGQGKPTDDRRLDRECIQSHGRVTRVEVLHGRPARVYYDFEVINKAGHSFSQSGSSFLPGGETRKEGDRIRIEYVPGEPSLSRAIGGRIVILPPLLSYFLYGAVLPGLFCLTLWFAAVLRLRHLMSHGDIAVGDVVSFRMVRFILPLMYAVEYRFRDRNASVHATWHWVRVRSALGERLQTNPKEIGVIHDRRGRGGSRLVMASDFAPVGPGAAVAQGAA